MASNFGALYLYFSTNIKKNLLNLYYLDLVCACAPGVHRAVCRLDSQWLGNAGKPLLILKVFGSGSRFLVEQGLEASLLSQGSFSKTFICGFGLESENCQIRLLYGINLCFFSGIHDKAGLHQAELDAALTDKYSSLFNYTIPMLIKKQIWMTRKTCGIELTVETYWMTCFSVARKLGCQFTAVIPLKQIWWKGQKTLAAHLTSAQKAQSEINPTQ